MAAFLGNKLVQIGTKIVGVGRNYAAHIQEMGAVVPKVQFLCILCPSPPHKFQPCSPPFLSPSSFYPCIAFFLLVAFHSLCLDCFACTSKWLHFDWVWSAFSFDSRSVCSLSNPGPISMIIGLRCLGFVFRHLSCFNLFVFWKLLGSWVSLPCFTLQCDRWPNSVRIGLRLMIMARFLVQEPLIFLKPTSSYVREGGAVEIPPSCTFLDHEVELGVVIGKKGRDIQESQAMDHVSGTPTVPLFRVTWFYPLSACKFFLRLPCGLLGQEFFFFFLRKFDRAFVCWFQKNLLRESRTDSDIVRMTSWCHVCCQVML